MREIKFRAYSNVHGMMDVESVSEGGTNVHCRYGYEPGGFYSKSRFAVDERAVRDGSKKNKVALMQFTGLRDKNGKEIYEGDILQTRPYGKKGREIWQVVYEVSRGCYYSYKARNGITNPLEMAFTKSRGLEVIGNIYENPELLANTSA